MKRHVYKWGNELTVPIPAAMAREASVRDGTQVDVGVEKGAIVVRRCSPGERRRDLVSLVARITDANRHSEV